MLTEHEVRYINQEIKKRSICDKWIGALIIIFLQELSKENIKIETIYGYLNAILDFDFYLYFISRNWENINNDDIELFRRILKRSGVNTRGVKLRCGYIIKFRGYYESNKHKELFF